MKKSDFRGFKQVFNFTFSTAFKTRSFIITMILMILAVSVVFPVMNYRNRPVSEESENVHKDDDTDFMYKKIYYLNESNVTELDFDSFMEEYNKYKGVKFEEVDYDEAKGSEVVGSEKEALYMHLTMDLEMGVYNFKVIRNKSMGSESSYDFAADITSWFSAYKTTILNLSEETINLVNSEVNVSDIEANDYLKVDTHDIISESEYGVVYALLLVVFMVVTFSASYVASKVVEEKANRIVEYLMTTVRPMALIMGKVLAMLLAIVTELALIVGAGYISNKVSAKAFNVPDTKTGITKFISLDALEKLNVGYIIAILVIIALGLFIFGLVAGLFGASVSKMEDVQQGLLVFNFILIACMIISVVAANLMWTLGINGFVKFATVFPLTAPFLLPGTIVVGKASALMVILTIVLMAIVAFLILKFVSLVYESVIVMNGEPISLIKMIAFARERRAKHE